MKFDYIIAIGLQRNQCHLLWSSGRMQIYYDMASVIDNAMNVGL